MLLLHARTPSLFSFALRLGIGDGATTKQKRTKCKSRDTKRRPLWNLLEPWRLQREPVSRIAEAKKACEKKKR